jgi:hypothetical protein
MRAIAAFADNDLFHAIILNFLKNIVNLISQIVSGKQYKKFICHELGLSGGDER